MLKIIPAFREQPGRLLLCATNFIRSVDLALLRHGRFDYVIPIGLPDNEAQTALWQRFIPATVIDQVDVDVLVEHTPGFTPVDIEFASRSASQRALEQAVYDESDTRALKGPTTQDYLDSIANTRATVSPAMAQEFLEDIETIARR